MNLFSLENIESIKTQNVLIFTWCIGGSIYSNGCKYMLGKKITNKISNLVMLTNEYRILHIMCS